MLFLIGTKCFYRLALGAEVVHCHYTELYFHLLQPGCHTYHLPFCTLLYFCNKILTILHRIDVLVVLFKIKSSGFC